MMRRAVTVVFLLVVLSALAQSSFSPIDSSGNRMEREDSIASRVSRRKRCWGVFGGKQSTSVSRRRKLEGSSKTIAYSDDDIEAIKKAFGDYQHHGTGNPLAVRAPSSREGHAVRTLANVIHSGVLGQVSSDSTPKLKTERGQKGSFWTCRLRLAGSYGWTGLVLAKNTKTDKQLPIENVNWFLVDSEDDVRLLKKLICEKDEERWKEVQGRVKTVAQFAELARDVNDRQTD